jgi:alkylhydroperoxidase family enzyme
VAATPDPPRIAPLPPGEWSPEIREAMAALRPANPRHPFPPRDPSRPKGLNALGTLARHPHLMRAYHEFAGHVLFGTTLSVRQRELAVLRVASLRQSEYEWRQHAVLAGDAGISDDEVGRVADGPDAPGWSPFERALLGAVDELVAGADISDGTWRVLAEGLDEQQLMDLVFTVGAYDVLAMAFRTFRVPLDADLT